MEKQGTFLHLSAIAVIILTLSVSSLGIIKPIKIGTGSDQEFLDKDYSVSFSVPKGYKTETTNIDSGRIVNVFPTYYSDQNDPRVIEIAYEKDRNSAASLEDLILSIFPGKNKGDLKRIQSYKVDGYELQVASGGTTTLYAYYKTNGYLYLIKFNESYYTDTSSALPINNRPYLGAYYKVLNSLEFNLAK